MFQFLKKLFSPSQSESSQKIEQLRTKKNQFFYRREVS